MKCLTLILLFTTLQSNAQKINPPIAKSVNFYNKNIVLLKPVYKNYITQTATSLHHRKFNVDSLKASFKTSGNTAFINLNTSDINNIIYMIAQAAETQAYNDIKEVMSDMDKNRKKKDSLRNEENNIHSVQVRIMGNSTEALKRLVVIKKEKDSLEELSQQDTLQLQQLMEEKNKMETIISNVMKIYNSNTSDIIKNLKG